MCNSSNCSHDSSPWDDLEDPEFSGRAPITPAPAPVARDLADAMVEQAKAGFVRHESRAAAAGHRYEEKCDAKGCVRGRFVGYTGRVLGECFKCKGKGVLQFKTSPEERAKAAVARDRKAEDKAVKLQNDRQAWIDANGDDFAWMKAKEESFEFARSMYDALMKYGSLTEKQHATVTRLRLADAERAAARKAEAEARAANAPVVDAGRIEQAFAHAQGKGVKRPRMTLDGFKISLAPATGRNAGALYVVRKADDQYLGKIMDGRFSRVRECDAETEAHVVRIINDPKGEAIAYGQRTGNCCICNRELTNHASIDAGIGPICAEKFGW